jgi:hypothetical protein
VSGSRRERSGAGPRGGAFLRLREADIFTCFADTVVAPRDGLPPVHATDAARALDAHLAAVPPANRVALRWALLALELAPRGLGFGARLRRLPAASRTAALERLDANPLAGPALKALRGLAQLCYYGDEAVLAQLGYDADAVVARGRELRRTEARW